MAHRELNAHRYHQFSEYLAQQCGIVLGTNKQYLVRSRLSPLLRQFSIATMPELVDKVVTGHDRALRVAVIDAMTTNETLWFRDSYPFTLLKRDILPSIAGQRRLTRIWSAACSSGQEPYSIAMTILEAQREKKLSFSKGIDIIGTDLSLSMLEQCKAAEYDSYSVARGLSDTRRKMFFDLPTEGQYRVKKAVRDMVTFRPLNLLDSYVGLGKFDIIYCRNVLIYFSNEIKVKILQQIAASLNKDGILFLGASESIAGLTQKFEMIRAESGLYYRKK